MLAFQDSLCLSYIDCIMQVVVTLFLQSGQAPPNDHTSTAVQQSDAKPEQGPFKSHHQHHSLWQDWS